MTNLENQSKKLNTYLSLCTEVYDLSKPKPPEDAYKFYCSYVEKAKSSILEPMCGTGRFLLPFVEEGFSIHGFDASNDMLNALHKKAKAKNLKLNVWQSFVEDLNRPERYNLIYIPSGSFSLILDQESVKKALQIFFVHLTKSGIFLFEADTYRAVPPLNVWRESRWARSDNKVILLSQCTILKDNICNSKSKYELIDNNQIIHTEVEELKFRLYEAEELINLLKNVGFKNIRTIKPFEQGRTPDEHDETIVYECYK